MSCKQSCGGDMGRMFSVDFDVGHGRDNGREDNIPILGGVLVQAHLD